MARTKLPSMFNVERPGQSGNKVEINRSQSADLLALVKWARDIEAIMTSFKFDPASGALVTITEVHHQIHLGNFYSVEDAEEDLDAAEAMEVLIITPVSGRVHIGGGASAEVDGVMTVFEGPTTTDDGTPLNIVNRNRNSTNLPGTQLFSGPTVTEDGIPLPPSYIPGGQGTNSAGAVAQVVNEFVAKANTKYLVRLTNVSTTSTNQRFAISIDFYETADFAP